MEAITIKVPVNKVVSSTDRKYGGEGNIETLAQSIKKHGLIHPLAVKENQEAKGTYRVIAGRRRYEAVKFLGYKTVEVTVYPEKADEAAIALAENVNREDMHPLDEAETFKSQLDAGKPVEEIARYYNRSVSGIHQRVRLTGLADEIKMMFRDGKINLSGAALIASLPVEDQEKFHKKHGEKGVNHWDISEFIRKAQRLTLGMIADTKCGKCKNRTYNTAPGLFDDEYSDLKDVCFDEECYAEKWRALIAKLIAKQQGDTEKKIIGDTERNIILEQNIPKFLPKKTEAIMVSGEEYTLLSHNKYTWKETDKKGKTKTAWLVSAPYPDYKVTVSRVAYKEYERPTYGSYNSAPADPVKEFMIDQLPDIQPEDRKAVAEKVQTKFNYPSNLAWKIKNTILGDIIERRLQEGSPENLAACYLIDNFSGVDKTGKWHEVDPDLEDVFATIFGPDGITKYSEIPMDNFVQKIFLFFIIARSDSFKRDMPDLNDSEAQWAEAEASLFWKFAGLTRKEYTQMYRAYLSKAIEDNPEPEEPPAIEPAADEFESAEDSVPQEDE